MVYYFKFNLRSVTEDQCLLRLVYGFKSGVAFAKREWSEGEWS